MKKQLWLNSRMLSILTFSALFNFVPSIKADAQNIVNANDPDTRIDIHNTSYACSTDVNVYSASCLNADMLQAGGDKLWTIAYTIEDMDMKYVNHPLYGNCAFYTGVPTQYSGFYLDFPSLPHWAADQYIPDAEDPDIVLGHDQGGAMATGEFLLGVVYNSTSNPNNVEMATWDLSNFVTGGTPAPSVVVDFPGFTLNDPGNGRIARDPHIDLWPDNASPSAFGNNSLTRFVATWTEFDPAGPAHYIMVAVGDLDNPMAFNRYQIPLYNPNSEGISPDVAAQMLHGASVGTSKEIAFVTYIDPAYGNALRLAEVDLTGGVLGTVNHTTLSNPTDNIDVLPPRVEAQVYYDNASTQTRYIVAASVLPTTGTNYEINTFNDITGKDVLALSSTEDHFSPAVAGVGDEMDLTLFGGVGQEFYSVAYYTTYTNNSTAGNGDIFLNSMDILSGAIFGGIDYFEVNSADLDQPTPYSSHKEIPVAITSTSNNGDDQLVVWFNGFEDPGSYWGDIKYKFGGNTHTFKPTFTKGQMLKNNVKVYPNPTTTKLTIEGAEGGDYTVMTALGQTVASGSIISSKADIDVSSYASGVYMLSIEIDGKTERMKFVKD